MVDALVSGASVERRAGSSPVLVSAQLRQYSVLGTTPELTYTAVTTTFPILGVLQ